MLTWQLPELLPHSKGSCCASNTTLALGDCPTGHGCPRLAVVPGPKGGLIIFNPSLQS